MYEVVNFSLPIIDFMTIRMLFQIYLLWILWVVILIIFLHLKIIIIWILIKRIWLNLIFLFLLGPEPEIFQECNEIVSYLSNRTLYELVAPKFRGILLEDLLVLVKLYLLKLLLLNAMLILLVLLLVNLLNFCWYGSCKS